MRITQVLAVQANGVKVTPQVILKGKDRKIEKSMFFGRSTNQSWVNNAFEINKHFAGRENSFWRLQNS